MNTGYFITFEGPEGSGKSTQAKLLAEELKKLGYHVVLTREPGGTPVGEEIREILLNKDLAIASLTELLLYVAARAQIMADLIIPALKEGKIVICDRFIDSSMAYQGWARGLGFDLVKEINTLVLNGIEPQLTILLDIEPALGLARVRQDGFDRLEQEDISFHEKVREGYLYLSEENKRFQVYDARKDKGELQKIILQKVLDLVI